MEILHLPAILIVMLFHNIALPMAYNAFQLQHVNHTRSRLVALLELMKQAVVGQVHLALLSMIVLNIRQAYMKIVKHTIQIVLQMELHA